MEHWERLKLNDGTLEETTKCSHKILGERLGDEKLAKKADAQKNGGEKG